MTDNDGMRKTFAIAAIALAGCAPAIAEESPATTTVVTKDSSANNTTVIENEWSREFEAIHAIDIETIVGMVRVAAQEFEGAKWNRPITVEFVEDIPEPGAPKANGYYWYEDGLGRVYIRYAGQHPLETIIHEAAHVFTYHLDGESEVIYDGHSVIHRAVMEKAIERYYQGLANWG